jgi:hypothetical protein
MSRLPLPAAECLSLDALSPRERRARFSVGLGCPSFGGQRTVRGHFSRLLASLVTDLKQPLLGKRVVGLRQVPSSVVLCESLCNASVAASGYRPECSVPALPNSEPQMPEVSTSQRRASGPPTQSLSPVMLSRSGHPLAQSGSPNRSVKGTSRKRAAPYVER